MGSAAYRDDQGTRGREAARYSGGSMTWQIQRQIWNVYTDYFLAVNVTPNPTPFVDDAVTDRSTSKSTVSRIIGLDDWAGQMSRMQDIYGGEGEVKMEEQSGIPRHPASPSPPYHEDTH